jgi:hypothetical protein
VFVNDDADEGSCALLACFFFFVTLSIKKLWGGKKVVREKNKRKKAENARVFECVFVYLAVTLGFIFMVLPPFVCSASLSGANEEEL